MKVPKPFFALCALLLLFSCNQPRIKKSSSSHGLKLPPDQQGLVDQFHHAVTLIPHSLSNDRKRFLEDSLKNSIDHWLSDKTGLKANRWIAVVMNDTIGRSFGAAHGGVLQLYFPLPKGAGSTGTRHDAARSITLTMSVDEDDSDMAKARKHITDGDTVVFSGNFTPMSRDISDVISPPGPFLANPALDLTPTELYKKGSTVPSARPEPDTAGLAKAPVLVIAKIAGKKIDQERFITTKVTIKNISSKPITKLNVRWLVINKAGQPATVNGATGAWQQGYFNQNINPGETITQEWLHESPDGEKVQLIFPKSVDFYDGIKWRSASTE